MKKLFSTLLAAALVAGSAISANAAAGLYTYDESDGEYWNPAFEMLDQTAPAIILEDGTIGGYNDPSYTDATGANLMTTLTHGWYEVILCNLGTNAEWFPAEVSGKVALVVRGDSTFTVKSENSMNAGAIACLVGNNCRAVELVDETGTMTGEYENTTMSVEYYTIPMCSLSSDICVRLVASTADISIADAVVAVENVFFGDLELSVTHKKPAYVFFGTLEEYAANSTRTDANTVTAGGGLAGTAAATTEAAAPAATEAAPAAYPASGTAVPADSVLINGDRIGNEFGWDGTAASGRASAFDGNVDTFYDPATASVDWCGIDAGEEMILTKIIIHPRKSWTDRFNGATIEASNDPEFEESVELFFSAEAASAEEYIDCTAEMEESENTGYRYFRYINYMSHGDVAEVELYGKAKDGSNPTYGAEAAAEAPAATEAPAAEAAATEVVAIDAAAAYQDYPSVDPIADPGAGFATAEEAVAAIGKTAISGYTFVSGTNSFANEGPENLWDGDTATKFCANEFPTISIAALDGEYVIDGIIMATANDNAEYNNRIPYEWAIYGSKDGAAWTAIAYGDDYFFEETNFTYYASAVNNTESYKYIMFQSEGGLSGTFQVSEVVVTGTKVEAAAPVVEEPVVEEPVVEAPVVEEPVVEEPVVEEPVVEETVVEEAVVEETVEETEEEAAQTFDFGVIAVVAAIVSAAGYALSKKR